MKKLGTTLLVLVLFLCVAAGGAGWFAYTKIKSGDLSFLSLISKAPSTDLGITYTEQQAQELLQTIQTEAKAVSVGDTDCQTTTCVIGKPSYSGSQIVSTTLSNSDGTALINEWIKLGPNVPFTSAQMRVNGDGSVDFAGTVSVSQLKKFGSATNIPSETMAIADKYLGSLGETFPIRASGTLAIKNNAVDANFSSISFGILPVPGAITAEYKDEIDSFLEDRLATVQGLSITELSFAEGKTTFKGTVPKTIYFVR